jgi:ribonucleoside-diphosphate reductase alpha chain
MQAAMQAFVDNSLSKTINFPADASYDDVATAYQLAWTLGCKGITVYVTGSREQVVLETNATKDSKKGNQLPESSALFESDLDAIWTDTKKPRPRSLPGYTYSIETPLGKAFITINENGQKQPFEVFINTAKAGSDTAAVSEAIGRLISYILRLSSPLSPIDRLKEVFRQLAGIGGGRPMGFGPNRVRSLPDGVSQVLDEYLIQHDDSHGKYDVERGNNGHTSQAMLMREPVPTSEGQYNSNKIGDLCPECGQAAVVNEEGCRKCYACGYSEC